ncbi:MAG: T9SS type A sorting domain-containing protein [Flavobacteriales bacterium]|nr:T9SS type A sorting domain-containing protein [Flavobacteriales bacterium]
MKKLQLLSVLTALITFSFNSIAQQSCSFIIHVDGVGGTDDAACGGEETPCASINYGIQRAVTENYSDVRIMASINYQEIIELVDGINLWGGFDAQWAASGLTTITGGMAGNGEYYAVNAEAINSPTLLSDLEIIGPDAVTPGKSSYGIHITNSTGLKFQRVTIQGGAGANGTSGTNGTDATVAAANGTNGGNADEFNTACNSSSSGSGGTGGVASGNANTAGGNGGRGGYMDSSCSGIPNYNATSGIAGANAAVFVTSSYGYQGPGGGTCNPGNDGQNGQTVHGNGGTGATSAANVTGMFWTALSGNNGTLGANGGGGGGGGGSGGCDDGTDSYGAGGGGGGSGGVAASTFGSGALSGGNSAAVFMLASTSSFIDCIFIIGTGGNGANGGNSGNGTAGGLGGNGGNASGDSDAGGKGGDGGAGGNSGGGGGGAGGTAYGIYASNSTVNRSGSVFNVGMGGFGGNGGLGTPAGVAGTDGTGGTSLDIAGTVTDNVGVLALEEDPCTEIITTDLGNVTFCAGAVTIVDFTAVGSFSGTNTFTVQLSDANGDFTSPTDIGSIVSSVAGSIGVQFPVNTISGTGYRIRVVSSATPTIGVENATDIVINALPNVIAIASNQTVCAGEMVTLTGDGADLYTWDNNVVDGVAFTPTETGYYTVTGTDLLTACTNIDSVEVTVVELPDAAVAQNGNELAAVLAGATYQWVDCDNNYAFITGEEGQTFTASASGNYAVIVTMNACSSTSDCFNIITVGIDGEVEKENTLILYPNPSTGSFQLISDVEHPMQVSIFNAMGQLIHSEGNVTNNTTLDLRGVSNGLYSIRFHNEDLNLLRQVIIQK